jgi:hypothetical protein
MQKLCSDMRGNRLIGIGRHRLMPAAIADPEDFSGNQWTPACV